MQPKIPMMTWRIYSQKLRKKRSTAFPYFVLEPRIIKDWPKKHTQKTQIISARIMQITP